ELEQQREAALCRAGLAENAGRILGEQFAERAPGQRPVGDAALAAVHVAEYPRLADGIGGRRLAVQEAGQPPPAPQVAREDRLEPQRVEVHARASGHTLSIRDGGPAVQIERPGWFARPGRPCP